MKRIEMWKSNQFTSHSELRIFRTLFAICYLLFAILGCARKEVEAPKPLEEETIEQKISTFNLAGYGEGAKLKWEIEGKTADIFEDIVKLDTIVAKAYGEDRHVTVTADKGSVNKATNNIHLEQNVVAKTSDGATLTTEYLDWDAKKEIVTTDAKVLVQRENVTTQGKGAFAQPDLKKVKLNEDVVVNINEAPKAQGEPRTEMVQGEPAVITCSGPMDVDYANNVAVFNENVKVKDTRGELVADKMIVYFDQKTQKITKVVAKGNVKITRGENVSTSDEAVYLADENKVTLSGNPKVVIYPKK